MYKNFPYNSPYAYCENKVINGIELEGLEHIFYAFVTDKKTSQISIVEVSRIDATVKLITGQVVNCNTSEKSYILGSDGNFHEIPEAWLNRSLLPNGESLEKSMNRINGWKINNQAFKISENVKALQRLSEQANLYLGVLFFASGIKVFKGKFTVNSSKFDYFFGRVKTGSTHNIKRSADNLKDLTTLGIKNESQLINVFNQAFESGKTVSIKTNEFGTTITKSIQIGNKGAVNVGFFYKGGDLSSKPSVSTIIPKIYK